VHSFGLVYHILWKLAYLRKLLRKFHEIFLVLILCFFRVKVKGKGPKFFLCTDKVPKERDSSIT
jgi:hypothetical protein